VIYTPNGWVILKLESSETLFFKIFGTWRGDYLTGDSWRLSSGSDKKPKLSECGKHWIWPQLSGSCYHLLVNGEGGMSFYTEHVLKNILSSKRLADTGTSIEIISLDDLID